MLSGGTGFRDLQHRFKRARHNTISSGGQIARDGCYATSGSTLYRFYEYHEDHLAQ